MWSCMRNSKVSAEDTDEKKEPVKKRSSSKPAQREESMKKKKKKKVKKVRFEISDDRGENGNDGDCTSGTRRIRLVVTKEELRRMVMEKDAQQYASLEQLLKDMKMREKRKSEVEEEHDDDGGMNSWRPGLESIPEDSSMRYSFGVINNSM
ncbi:hypothetical protein PIB30_048799 [Stylosanthes scabra]|uniref:Uncharacterized protein n=1 Tax=Stylosanthes scabra TaxID=79078 RepID=A0ABU6XID4_9FABA|nr:hypothetical protein [Stylosanthes scabra]